MDHVQHPLDGWAYESYEEVMRQPGWKLAKALREVRKTINSYGRNPIGHKRYERLRQTIMDSRALDTEPW